MKKLMAAMVVGVLFSCNFYAMDKNVKQRRRARSCSIVTEKEFWDSSSAVPEEATSTSIDIVKPRAVSFADGTKEHDGPTKYSSSVVAFAIGHAKGKQWNHLCELATTIDDVKKAYKQEHPNRVVTEITAASIGMGLSNDAKIVDFKNCGFILSPKVVFVKGEMTE